MQILNRYINLPVITFAVLLLVLARAGTILWPQLIICGLVSVLFLINLAFYSQSTHASTDKYWIIPWLALSFVILLQLTPGLGAMLYGDDFGVPLNRISIIPSETISYWSMFTCYWLVAWFVSRMDIRQIKILLLVIFVLITFQIFYGVYAFVNRHGDILIFWQRVHVKYISGTFLNVNHYSAFFEIAVPMVLSYFAHMRIKKRKSDKSIFALCLMSVTVLLSSLIVFATLSRLGIIAFLLGLIIWFSLSFNMSEKPNNKIKKRTYLLIIFFLLMILGVWFGLGTILENYADIPDSKRFSLWKLTLTNLPNSIWILGAGAGTFVDSFRTISTPEFASLTWHKLHSDWLEFFVDFGLIGASLIIASIVYWIAKVRIKQFSIFHAGAFSGIVAIIVHSAGDFVLQTPGVAIVFWIAVGLLMNEKITTSKS